MAREALPTGEGTAPKERDVSDPHPDNEEQTNEVPHPGGDHGPHDDIGANPGKHDGTPRRPPRNVETEG